MRIHNTENSYGIITKALHWLVGLLIIAVWIIGYYAEEITDVTQTRHILLTLHKSLGMLILMLVVVRLSWRLYDGASGLATMNPILVIAAKTVHYLFYLFMFIQPLSGWAMSSAAGYAPTFFNWFQFPGIVAKNQALVPTFFAIHNTSAWLLLILVVMHVSAALIHYFVFKENILKRML